MSNDDDSIRFSAGAPPGATYEPPAPPPAAPKHQGRIIAAVLIVGLGIGYAAFHKNTPTPGPTIASWSSAGGQSRIAEFSADIDELTTAANAQDPSGVHKACVALQSTVESAQAYRPIPDAQAQASWAAALAAYARGAADCIAGTDRLDATLIDQFNSELGVGNSSLEDVATRLKQINGS